MHLVANCLSPSGCSVGSHDTAKFPPFAGVSFKSCYDDLETENGIDHHKIEIYWNILKYYIDDHYHYHYQCHVQSVTVMIIIIINIEHGIALSC